MPHTRTVLYAAVGPTLRVYRVGTAGTLISCGSIRLPAAVQYAYHHASARTLYVASSDSGPGRPGKTHHLTALRIDPLTGELASHGAAVPLPWRPIHITVDPASRHVLVAFNDPPAVRIYRIAANESLDGEADAVDAPDLGFYPHHVRVTPDGRYVVVVCRGNDATPDRPERPGSLRIIGYDDGRLRDVRTIAPGGGYGFGPRDIDFHPDRPWMYVSSERQNELLMFASDGQGLYEDEPRWRISTLADVANAGQVAGPLHVHPRGHVIYVVNRGTTGHRHDQRSAEHGLDNTIAVHTIDPSNGKPHPIQHVDTRGFHCRTFQIDPTGSLLVTAPITAGPTRLGSAPHGTANRMSIFRIAPDGRLTLVDQHEVDVGSHQLFWIGIVPLPTSAASTRQSGRPT